MSERFDAVVVGAGIAGETCARRLNAGGKRVAIVERDLVGGECAFWARVPSKTLLGPANEVWRAQQVAGLHSPAWSQAPYLAAGESPLSAQDDSLETKALAQAGIELIRGEARLLQPGQICVGRHTLEASCTVIATGSSPRIPDIDGLDQVSFWTNREACRFQAIPQQILVLGGEPQAIELAQMFRLYGAEVTLVSGATRLITREDPQIGGQMARHLQQSGIRVLLGQQISSVARAGDGDIVAVLGDQSTITTQTLVVSTGRVPRTDLLADETAGIRFTDKGVVVDEMCRAAKGVWAIGDVTGVLPLSHIAQYQAHVVADDILGFSHPATYQAVPRLYFTDPQIAATGLTREGAYARKIEVASAMVELKQPSLHMPIAFSPETAGKLVLYADRESGVLIGAWAMAPDAADWMELPVLAISAAIPLHVLGDTIEQFPGFSEPYRVAVQELSRQISG